MTLPDRTRQRVAHAQSTTTPTMKDKPIHEIRLGAIKAVIWKNESSNGRFYNAIFTRLYKDGEEWKTSASFGRDDLPLLASIAGRANSWIYDQIQAEAGQQSLL